MNREWRRYAPIGIYVTILALLIGSILYFLRREFDVYVQVSLAVAVLGLAAFIYLDPDRVRRALSGRQARYGSNAFVIVLATLGIIVVVNYLSFTYNQRWDLTEDRVNTLSQETLDVVAALPEPVSVMAFYESASDTTSAVDTLERFREASDGNFAYEFVDPVQDPFAANDAGVTQPRQLVLTMGNRQEIVDFANETQITEALVRLMSGERHVYFLVGHGEASISSTGGDTMSTLRRSLESRNYTVDELNLLSSNAFPEDADLLVVAGPQVPLQSEELELIDEFLQAGGSAVFMEDSTIFLDGMDSSNDSLADYLEESWGITLGDDVILDFSGGNQNVTVTYAFGLDTQHPIGESLVGVVPAFVIARSVEITGEVEGVSQQHIASTDPNSAYGETDFEGLLAGDTEVAPDEGEEIFGPGLVAVAEAFETEARIVVIGDSDFARDDNFAFQSNGNLLLNAIDWASEQENLISLNPNTPTVRFLPPPQPAVLNALLLVSVCLIPGGMVVAGGVVWWRRRNRK